MIKMTRATSVACFLLVTATLSGCDALFTLGAESKINSAIPISAELENARKAVADEVAGSQQKSFDAEWKRRMTLRALNCAKGYTPSWYTSVSTVRDKLTDRSCFHDQDLETAKWVGYLRLGSALTKPALKQIPANFPKLISADAQIRGAAFADNAGVAVITTDEGSMLLIDLASGEVIRRNKAPEGTLGILSPNGRLVSFGSPSNSYVSFYSTETGEEVSKVYKTREWQMHWLANDCALYSKDDNRKVAVVDFTSGKEVEVPFSNVIRVFPVPGQLEQFIVGTWTSTAKLALSRMGGETSVKILEERKLETGHGWSRNMTYQTINGSLIVNLSVSQFSLSLLDVQTLESNIVDFGPGAGFHVISATADSDKLILRTNALVGAKEVAPTMRDYIYSISDKTITPLQLPIPSRLIFVPSLKAVMGISGSRIERYEPTPSADNPIPVQQVASERRIYDAERKMALAEQTANSSDSRGGPVPYSYKSAASPMPAPGAASAPLSNLAADTRVEAVGVYQGAGRQARSGQQPSPASSIEVRVRRSDKPIILVLSSYEAVRWMLITEPGARIAAVFLSGYNQSSVVGAGSARIISMGQKYAYSMQGREFRDLDDDVFRLTGRRIALLQGRYEGNSFSVGGQL